MGGLFVTTKTPAVRKSAKKTAPARMEYMGHDRVGIINMRRAVTRDVKHDVLRSADRAFALAFDFMQNSGWIAGAADQIIADMIGTELKLNARPDLARLGYSDAERAAWCRLVENEWRRWSWTPRECDVEGRATVQEMLDGAARYYLAGGEAIAVLDYMSPAIRQRYGVRSGVKARLVSPHRLSRYTSPFEGWDQGIYCDENGRPTHYRFRVTEGGMDRDLDLPVMAGAIQRIVHTMDRGATPNSPRGISPMAPAFKVIAQSDQLADATLTTALLQTAFAATITSPEPSDQAFMALQQIVEMDGEEAFEGAQALATDLLDVWQQRIDSLKTKRLSIGGDASQVNHLGPGESLQLHTANAGGPHYEAFQRNLLREVARCMGVTVESLTMDHSSASYSSTRMAVASVWPTIIRRRERIVAPIAQGIYEAWLDEAIAEGRIPFKGGYRAFAANRDRVIDSEWRGPPRPSADPYKDALAEKVRMESGTMTIQEAWAERGLDWEEGMDQIAREHQRFEAMGVRSPFGRSTGGGAGPLGAAAPGRRDEADAD